MKITLMDIMESLNSENMEDAQAALHEWFVEQGKQVHTQLTTPITETATDDAEAADEADEAEEVNEATEETSEDDVVEEAAEAEEDKEEVTESDEADEEEETVEESADDLIAELSEAFAGLEKVSDKLQNVEGAQVGEEGKVPVNTKSALPSKKGAARVGGDPVEIKSDEHKGHALEKAPAVKDAPVKHHVQNSKDDLKKVGAEKGALLNKMDGSVNTQSPISGKGAKGLKK